MQHEGDPHREPGDQPPSPNPAQRQFELQSAYALRQMTTQEPDREKRDRRGQNADIFPVGGREIIPNNDPSYREGKAQNDSQIKDGQNTVKQWIDYIIDFLTHNAPKSRRPEYRTGPDDLRKQNFEQCYGANNRDE